MSDQFSFISARWPSAKPAKRAQILAVLEKVVPWSDLEANTRKIYQADARKTGRKGYSLRMMLRCLALAYVWRLSDDGLVDFILDSLAAARFVGCDPWAPRPPSASAFRNFRRLVGRCDPHEFWFASEINKAIVLAGIEWRQGAVVEPQFRKLDGSRFRSAPPA